MVDKLDIGEVYRGPVGQLKDSPWITAESIPHDRDTVLQIESVMRRRNVVFKTETKRTYGSLRFKNEPRELGLCATNLAVLKALFGPETGAYFGKFVALYVTEVSAFGKMVPAVRIRAKKIDAPKEGA